MKHSPQTVIPSRRRSLSRAKPREGIYLKSHPDRPPCHPERSRRIYLSSHPDSSGFHIFYILSFILNIVFYRNKPNLVIPGLTRDPENPPKRRSSQGPCPKSPFFAQYSQSQNTPCFTRCAHRISSSVSAIHLNRQSKIGNRQWKIPNPIYPAFYARRAPRF